ncbi:CD3073 family putative ECF transporter S component [Miniphocaeibacter massiliensis]|uniref:CD3073 family putative ECF transporter S component n=1 Tax=Miniphocaeibacter massiliensis TaxID=2041841 RepID=UPI000C1BFD7E|nr:CD3073 family putative ECF transporter S component [Miniphocaeibacter massiliensis]
MNNKTKILVYCAIAVVINVVVGTLVSATKIPLLFLDTVGTILIAAKFGMFYGILTGASTNLLMGVTSGPTAIPFAFVNVAIAIVVALISRKDFTYKKAIIAGLILAFVAPMIGAPIRLVLFGGFTGSGTDLVIIALKSAGKEMLTSVYWGAVAGNLVDKLISCLLVAWLLKKPEINKALSVN